MKTNFRCRISGWLKDQKIFKTGHLLIGCSKEELKWHLEKQFKPGMTWDNYGKWHVDHIIPLYTAKTEQEVYKLYHYTNLQPLWAEENLRKNKY